MAYSSTTTAHGVFEQSATPVGRYLVAALDASGDLVAAADDTVRPVGIAQLDSPKAGQETAVEFEGITQVTVDGSGTAIAIDDPLMASSGKLVKWVATAGTGLKYIVGYALEASTADGDIISVDLRVQAINDTAA